MIELITIPVQDCLWTTLFSGSGEKYPVVTSTGIKDFTIPPLIVMGGKNWSRLLTDRELVPFGYIHQGEQVIGAMRDHDVLHLGAHGSLTLNSMIGPVTPVTLSARPITMGQNIKIGARTTLASSVIAIGQDYTASYSYTNAGIKAKLPNTSTYVRSDDVLNASFSVRWDKTGTRCVCEGLFSKVHFVYDATGLTWWDFEGGAYAMFWDFSQGQQHRCSQSYMTARSDTDPGLYTFPDGSTGVPGSLDPDRFFDTVYLASLYPVYAITKVGVITTTMDSVKYLITSGSMTRFASTYVQFLPDPFDWGELGGDIIRNQKHVDANLLLTAFDLLRLKKDIRSWKNIAKTLRTQSKRLVTGSIKSVASLKRWLKVVSKQVSTGYLGVSYGVLPTLRDGRRVIDGLASLAYWPTTPRRMHARRATAVATTLQTSVTSNHTLTVQLAYVPVGLEGSVFKLIRSAKEWGVYPNFKAVWDLAPWSFVYDWIRDDMSRFVNVLDADIDSLYYPIDYCIMGTKRSFTPRVECWLPQSWGIMGSVTFTYYDRYMTQELPLPSMQTGDGESSQFNFWGEALALIIQQKK